MIGAGPYRSATSSSWTEEELWLSLDGALEEAIRDPVLAWGMAWSIVNSADAAVEVRRAAAALMSVLCGLP